MDSNVYAELVIASARVLRRLTREALPGESAADLDALNLLESNPGITISHFAELFGVSKPAASKHLVKLEGRGYVNKQRTDRDRRNTRVYITDEGSAYLKSERMAAADYLRDSFDSLSKEDLAAFKRTVEILQEKLKEPTLG
ncbi:MAG: MarR family transcriptional regulator [Corynebacterium sp.]|nr:MarR family transcriptional regulator [Corynebacterium sp.]